jgi:plastocyanin
MRKLIVLIAVIAIAVVAWLVLGNKNSPSTSYTPSSSSSSQSSTSNSNSSSNTATATDKVTIANFAFSPVSITVKKGTQVTWTNQDSTSHTVTENDGKNGPSAPPLNQGQTYSFTFNEVGTFRYHCSIHPEMTGTVTVTE